MNTVKSFFKIVLWSALLSAGIRIVFGLYSVFGAPTLIIPMIGGIVVAASIVPKEDKGFVGVTLLHIVLVTVFSVLWDTSGIFRMLASESADLFAKMAGLDDGRVNILWCILFVMPVYFISYVISSVFISSFRRKRYYEYEEETEKIDPTEEKNESIIRKYR